MRSCLCSMLIVADGGIAVLMLIKCCGFSFKGFD